MRGVDPAELSTYVIFESKNGDDVRVIPPDEDIIQLVQGWKPKASNIIVYKPKPEGWTPKSSKEKTLASSDSTGNLIVGSGTNALRKGVLRVFLDNEGNMSKMLKINASTCNAKELSVMMKKKMAGLVSDNLSDCVIFEVKDGEDVRVVPPFEDMIELTAQWGEDSTNKLVYKVKPPGWKPPPATNTPKKKEEPAKPVEELADEFANEDLPTPPEEEDEL